MKEEKVFISIQHEPSFEELPAEEVRGILEELQSKVELGFRPVGIHDKAGNKVGKVTYD